MLVKVYCVDLLSYDSFCRCYFKYEIRGLGLLDFRSKLCNVRMAGSSTVIVYSNNGVKILFSNVYVNIYP